jgi:hypothetical protein
MRRGGEINSKTTTSSQQPTLQSKGCEDPEERTGPVNFIVSIVAIRF